MTKMKKGFTLIELLIASSVFVVVMVTVYAAFSSGVFGSRNIEDSINSAQGARLILEQMNTDLRNAFTYSGEDTRFTGGRSQISFLTLTDTFSAGEIFPEYSAVTYNSEEDKLMRLCRRNKEALNQNSQIEAEEMSSGAEVVFQYGKISNENQELEFVDGWPDPAAQEETQKVLPQAVKVTLTIKGKTARVFERTIYLPFSV